MKARIEIDAGFCSVKLHRLLNTPEPSKSDAGVWFSLDGDWAIDMQKAFTASSGSSPIFCSTKSFPRSQNNS